MKHIVRKFVDAYVVYEAEIEADSPEQAAKLAEENEDQYDWDRDHIEMFDARSFETMPPEKDEAV